jgi:hypothetical protein
MVAPYIYINLWINDPDILILQEKSALPKGESGSFYYLKFSTKISDLTYFTGITREIHEGVIVISLLVVTL